MMIIDSHAHLIDEKIVDAKIAVERARENNVRIIITPTTEIADLKKAKEMTENFPEVFMLAGIHPENISKVDSIESSIKTLKEFIIGTDKVVGIGEIGLDFYWDKEKKTKTRQEELFRLQMELAAELDLPVAIHSREADFETMDLINGLSKTPKCQLHCFAGENEMLQWALEKGFYISFAGNITFKSATKLREVSMKVPLDRLLLETDSPYLAPEPVRGTVNTPSNVKIIGEFIAKMRGLTLDEVAQQTSKNALCLYSLEK